MTIKEINETFEIKARFQPYIFNPILVYTYVAPKDRDLYSKFMSMVKNEPTWSSSYYEILNNAKLVQRILFENFSQDTELEIYVASNDTNVSFRVVGTLQEYINHEKLNFKINYNQSL